jgi:hypothetical protein
MMNNNDPYFAGHVVGKESSLPRWEIFLGSAVWGLLATLTLFVIYTEMARSDAYNDGPDEFRLSIGQPVATFSEDGSPIPLEFGSRDPIKSGRPGGTIPAGTLCTVVEETLGDRDDLTPNRTVGIRVERDDPEGRTVQVRREHLRPRRL